jgi:protein involved in polysaccharide export with SLBB domain
VRFKAASFAFVLLVLGFASASRAQILDELPTSSATFANQGGAYYNFAGEGGCALKVSVWGYVRNPGRYNVPCETDLIDLLSFCGGPLDRGAESFLYRIKVVRRGGIDSQYEIARVFEVDVERFLQLTSMPSSTSELLLFPGDLIIVDGKESRGDTILRIAQIVVAITSIITSTIAVINLTK